MHHFLSLLRWLLAIPTLGLSLLIIPSQKWKRARKKCTAPIGFIRLYAPVGISKKEFLKHVKSFAPWLSPAQRKEIISSIEEVGAFALPVDSETYYSAADYQSECRSSERIGESTCIILDYVVFKKGDDEEWTGSDCCCCPFYPSELRDLGVGNVSTEWERLSKLYRHFSQWESRVNQTIYKGQGHGE